MSRPVRLLITSRDVLHSFYVPAFLFKRDLVPGQENEFELEIKPEEAGKTFDGLVFLYGFRDFMPRTQDAMAVALIKGRGALQDVIEGRFVDAVRKCNREWASLPESPYGQGGLTWKRAHETFARWGGHAT